MFGRGVFLGSQTCESRSVRLVYFKPENCVEEHFYVFIAFKTILHSLVTPTTKYGCDCL